jgi:hypothetical protein
MLPPLVRHASPYTSGLLLAILSSCTLATAPRQSSLAADGKPAVAVDHPQAMEAGLALFKSQVRELLIRHCFECHGGKKIEGEMNLIDRETLIKGGAGGPAIVAGKSSDSLLYKLIAHLDEPGMPYERPALPTAAVSAIARWIDLGAPYDKPLAAAGAGQQGRAEVTEEDRKFWSFQPLAAVAPPTVADEAWCRTPIDRFVLARLESAGLTPSAAVDRRRLIRRAYLDLIGLVPEPEEIDAFVADPDPQAYDSLIDRLLSSPHYGERWARHWLDLARFAESHGYEQDYDRPHAYHYRDFVIRAWNEDMPYDRYIRLQIAGDELEPDNPQAFCATGFLGAGTHATQITANQVEKERYDELDDMVGTIGTAVLGLTIGCARCHDHKYDPIPSRDYYRLLSTFTTTVRSEIDIDFHPERYRAAKAHFDAEHAPYATALSNYERHELPARLAQWLLDHNRASLPAWMIVTARSATSAAGANLTLEDDGSYLVAGKNADSDAYTFVVEAPLEAITALRVEAMADPSLPKNGPGRAENGNFALSSLGVTSAPLSSPEPSSPVGLVRPRATFDEQGFPIAAAIDANAKTAWAIAPDVGRNHAAVFEFASPVAHRGGSRLTIVLKFEGDKGHNIGRLRLALSALDLPRLSASPLDLSSASELRLADAVKQTAEINQILGMPAEQRSAEQQAALRTWFATIDPEWQRLRQHADEHLSAAPRPELTKVLVTSEGVPPLRLHTQGADFFEQTYILKRGDLSQKQEVASQGFLQVLMRAGDGESHWQESPPPGCRTSYRRRALARWITDVDAGAGALVARVIVNRLWQHHFGRGLVATPSDFGTQGARPSHPELLEWLAYRLVAGGWRLKPLHKLMMTSAVYLQSIDADARWASIDPENVLLWRRSRQRLEAETIRDAMLAAAGLLDRTLYGPGTLDENQRRRSIYFFVKRSRLIPLMVLFDAPEALTGIALRPATTVAPQALALLNNESLYRCAQALAERVASSDTDALDRVIGMAYRRALGRDPSTEERHLGAQFLAEQTRSYAQNGQTEARRLALADFCQALLCTNEFIYVE